MTRVDASPRVGPYSVSMVHKQMHVVITRQGASNNIARRTQWSHRSLGWDEIFMHFHSPDASCDEMYAKALGNFACARIRTRRWSSVSSFSTGIRNCASRCRPMPIETLWLFSRRHWTPSTSKSVAISFARRRASAARRQSRGPTWWCGSVFTAVSPCPSDCLPFYKISFWGLHTEIS